MTDQEPGQVVHVPSMRRFMLEIKGSDDPAQAFYQNDAEGGFVAKAWTGSENPDERIVLV